MAVKLLFVGTVHPQFYQEWSKIWIITMRTQMLAPRLGTTVVPTWAFADWKFLTNWLQPRVIYMHNLALYDLALPLSFLKCAELLPTYFMLR